MKQLLLASTSTVYGSGPLEYLIEDLKEHFSSVKQILFIPYARPDGISHEAYTSKVQLPFQKIDKELIGIHTFEKPIDAINKAEGIFTGGGNTFVLLNQLYQLRLLDPLREVILGGTPYLGTSAGSNIAGQTISTTNDMPIVYPPSFDALGLIPFNINPHYLDPIPGSKHMGETRETRIKEFHKFNDEIVVGLREGSFLMVKGDEILLKGPLSARIFEANKSPYELEPNTDLSCLF